MKEREEFLSELSRENTSKQDMLEKLEAKIQEQEEVRLKERQEFVEMLQRETEQLRLAKEKVLINSYSLPTLLINYTFTLHIFWVLLIEQHA